jgi:hypothetical protein
MGKFESAPHLTRENADELLYNCEGITFQGQIPREVTFGNWDSAFAILR